MSTIGDLLDTIELDNGYQILIYPDPEAENPREWDNFGKMLCVHGRYELGDQHRDVSPDDADSWESLMQLVEDQLGGVIALPMYMLDHSGLRISTEDFGDPWDSGQIGYVYVPVSKVIAEYGELSDEVQQKVLETLKAEVAVYDSYVSGGAVRYELIGPGGEQVEAVGGFYSQDDAEADARSQVPSDEE